MGVLTLFVLRASLGGGSCGVERKLTKAFLDVHLKVHCWGLSASAIPSRATAVEALLDSYKH